MKVVLCLAALVSLVCGYADISEKEHFEDIISKPDVLKAQLYCYLDLGPCDEIAAHHKGHIADAVATACAKCTSTHKHNVHMFIKAVSHLFPELYHAFRNKYDPDGKHYDIVIQKLEPF